MEKRFCETCGEELSQESDTMLNWVKSPNIYPKHETTTGKRVDYSGIKYTCKNERFFSPHSRYFTRNQ